MSLDVQVQAILLGRCPTTSLLLVSLFKTGLDLLLLFFFCMKLRMLHMGEPWLRIVMLV